MKLPISFLLYTASVGLAGFTGWQVYELLPLQKAEAKKAAAQKGSTSATDRLSTGRGSGPVSVDWRYSRDNRTWWEEFKNANFIGRPPPVVVDPNNPPGGKPTKEPEKPVTPLEDIIELACLVYDGEDQGKGALSHVVVRYKPESGVQPPEWYVRMNQASPLNRVRGPGDVAPPRRPGGNPNFKGAKRPEQRKTTPMPVAQPTANVLLQKVWIESGGNARRDPHLWPPFEHIRLVRVDPSAQSAYFMREAPPAQEGEDPPAGEQETEEQLFKTAANLSQEVLRELNELYGRKSGTGNPTSATPTASSSWEDVDETFVKGNRWNVGREDERAFANEDQFLEKVYFDTYTGRVSGRRGLRVTNLDPQLSAKFGVAQGDVLLSVNGRQVKTRAQALQFGKKEYKKGVRTFVTMWLSAGQEIERVYQLPDK